MNEVIDLVDDASFVGSSSSSPSRSSSPMRQHRKRRLPAAGERRKATTSTDAVIDLEASSSPSQILMSGKMTAENIVARGSRVIDLESPTLFHNQQPRKRPRSYLPAAINNGDNNSKVNDDDDDDDIIEILSPAAAKSSSVAAAAAKKRQPKSPLLYDLSKSTIDRIREVFPLVSRQKVQSFLDKASSYVDKGDETQALMMQIVMTVLSEHPLGESIPDEAFAAAAVGGHISRSEQCNDDGIASTNAAAATGKRKIAQLECNCCFVDYPFEEMVSCRSAGHLFCKTCLQKHTEQRVFGVGNLGVVTNGNIGNNNNNKSKNDSKALEILCMHPSGCTSGFHEWQLRKALSEKVLEKYDEMQYAAVIEQANTTGDISRCPKCNFIAFAEKTVTTFPCPQCLFKSCRECGEEAHPGIKCDEVETKTETDGRKNVEEAMTQALVRTCPRPFCRKKFLKTDGCNKMTCACGAFVCYVCRLEIPKNVAYAHFCQTPHCNHKSCGKCALYADVEKEDEKRVKEAAKKAAKEQKTDVDVESLLKNPNTPAAAARGGRDNVPGHIMQYHQQQIQQQMQQLQQLNRQLMQQVQQHAQQRQAQRQHLQQGGRGGGNNGRRRYRGGRRYG